MKVHVLHIPKTGGISLYRTLKTAGVDVTRSHDPDQVPDGALIVSLLRNPIDRAWSVYRHQVRQGRLTCSLGEFVQQPAIPWWWGVRNVQARYMRPGVLYGLTTAIPCMVHHICTMADVRMPAAIEWHGKDDGDGYTPREMAILAAAAGTEDMALYGMMEGCW